MVRVRDVVQISAKVYRVESTFIQIFEDRGKSKVLISIPNNYLK